MGKADSSDLGELVWARETPQSEEALAFMVIPDENDDKPPPPGTVRIQWERGDRVCLAESLVRENAGRRGRRNSAPPPPTARVASAQKKKAPTKKNAADRRKTTGRMERASVNNMAMEENDDRKRPAVDRHAVVEGPNKKAARPVSTSASEAAAKKSTNDTDSSESGSSSDESTSSSTSNKEANNKSKPATSKGAPASLEQDDSTEESDSSDSHNMPPVAQASQQPAAAQASQQPTGEDSAKESPTRKKRDDKIRIEMSSESDDDDDNYNYNDNYVMQRPDGFSDPLESRAAESHHHHRPDEILVSLAVTSSNNTAYRRQRLPEESKEDRTDERVYAFASHFFDLADKQRTTVGEIMRNIEAEMGVRFSQERKTRIQKFLKQLALEWKNGGGRKSRAPDDALYDLVVAADGAGSQIREQLIPVEPTYAGYVAYRGTLPVGEAPDDIRSFFQNAFSMYSYPGSRQHILVYLIPGIGGGTDPAEHRINWVWYRNKEFVPAMTDKNGRFRKFSVPAGLLSDAAEKDVVGAAKRQLPPQFAALVGATPHPYVQAIHDMSASRMVVGDKCRVVLLGDAAALARPHTASGTSKAAGDAMDLADLIEAAAKSNQNGGKALTPEQLSATLARWEDGRLRHIHALEQRGRMMGDQYGYEAPED